MEKVNTKPGLMNMIMDQDVKKELEVVISSDTEYMNILLVASYALNFMDEPVGFTDSPGEYYKSKINQFSIEKIDGWVKDNNIDLEEYKYSVLDSEGKAMVLMNEGKRVLLMGVEETYGAKSTIKLEKRVKDEFKEFDYDKDKIGRAHV